ncbi:MAG TPA: BON domain-containing protein [Burkholderiales bacterium]|nr:BON domain-containing protein [Burkholderiales bacterium]
MLAAIVLAACDSPSSSESVIDPSMAQQIAAERVNPDMALAQKVRKALGTGEGAAYSVDVTAADGNIVLWGTVDSLAERKRLETTAAGVVGVRALRDNLKIDPGA